MSRVVIIGNGIAGVTAARYIRKNSDDEILVISAESKYFFSRTALMYVYMGHMRFQDTMPYETHFWKKNRIELLSDRVVFVDTKYKKLEMEKGCEVLYDQLIIASGSKPNLLGWKGQGLKGVQGLYSKQDLDLLENNTKGVKSAVVVGGGLIGVELVEMLLSRGMQVHFLVREMYFWETVLPIPESKMLMNHFRKHQGLTVHYEEELEELIGDDFGRVSGVKTKKGTLLDVQFAGITIGVVSNIQFLQRSGIETNRGVLVNEFLETNIPNVYAIGDCAEVKTPKKGRKSVEQVWYTGRAMGKAVASSITGEKTAYNPGIWFNSAKFFDIEYQTYGHVGASLDRDKQNFVWQHETKELLLHFVFDKSTERFLGVNTFGIRLRHELFNAWINTGKSIDYVIQHLATANFDPEFYHAFEKDIIVKYNEKFQKNIALKKKTWWRNLIKA